MVQDVWWFAIKHYVPNFFVLGETKCGTSSLASMLSQHLSIYVPRIKETGFLTSDEEYEKGFLYYADSYFKAGADMLARGEAPWLLPPSRCCLEGGRIYARHGVTVLNEKPIVEKPVPDPETVAILKAFCRPEIKRFEEMIGRDLSNWLN